MKNHIVNLIVPMNRLSPVLWLRRAIRKEGQHFRKLGYFAHKLLRVGILGARLRRADGPEGLDLTIVEARWLAVRLQTYGFRIDAVQLREGAHGVVPHLRTLCGLYAGNRRVLDDAAVEKLHDVEGCPDDAVILAETVDSRDADVGVL